MVKARDFKGLNQRDQDWEIVNSCEKRSETRVNQTID